MSEVADSTKVIWTNEEWEHFAALLHAAVPQADYLHSADLATLSIRELRNAGALMARPRTAFTSVSMSRAKLLEAFARVRAKGTAEVLADAARSQEAAPAPAQTSPRKKMEVGARWDDAEWEQFAALLHAAVPQADYLHSADLAMLTIRELNEAGAKMERPRTKFASVIQSRDKILEAFARLRDKLPGSSTDTEARVRRAPAPCEPPSPLKLDANSRPVASAPAERPPEKKTAADPFTVIAWDRAEWLAVATELDRMYVGSDYTHREHLTGLTSEDVAFAQRVLPVERHIRHLKVASFSTILPQLQQGFRDLKEQRRLQAEADAAAARRAQEEAERHTRNALDKAAGPAQQAAPAAVNPYEAVFAPLVDLVLGMLVDRLRPAITSAIDQVLNTPATPATAQPAPAPAETSQVAAARAAEEKAPQIRIGIVGNRSTYGEDLRREFPNVRFTCIDSKREIDSIKNCDRVIFLTKFNGHDLERMVRRAVTPEQFTRVNGCLSDLRRVLTGMLSGPVVAAQRPSVPAFAH